MNKKGQGLQLSTVILALLGIAVVVIVMLVLFGGTTWFKEKVLGIAAERLKGADITLTQQQCGLYCDYAKELSGGIALMTSSYCTVKYNLDLNGNGEIEEDEKGKRCKDVMTCENVDNNCE